MLDTSSPITAVGPVSAEEIGAKLDACMGHVISLALIQELAPEVATGALHAMTAAKVALTGDPVFADVLLNLHAVPGKPPARPKFAVIEGGTPDHF